MTWKIVNDSNDCVWLELSFPEDMKNGEVKKICENPENLSEDCTEENCPKSLKKQNVKS